MRTDLGPIGTFPLVIQNRLHGYDVCVYAREVAVFVGISSSLVQIFLFLITLTPNLGNFFPPPFFCFLRL